MSQRKKVPQKTTESQTLSIVINKKLEKKSNRYQLKKKLLFPIKKQIQQQWLKKDVPKSLIRVKKNLSFMSRFIKSLSLGTGKHFSRNFEFC